MSTELPPGALSLDDATLDSPPVAPLPPEPAAEPEPEGIIEVQGRRMVPVDALVKERGRVREATERAIREKEIAPLQAKAAEVDNLRAALRDALPHLQHLQRHPELMEPPKPTPIEEQIPEEEARAEAQDLELYDPQGKPDVSRARRIIARRRTEVMSAAQQAAQAAVGPITSQTAQTSSRDNFVQMATKGRGRVDPAALASKWTQLPTELTQHPEVAELVLHAAIGEAVLGARQEPGRGPQASEASGGRGGPGFRMSQLQQRIARSAGMSDEAFAKGAGGFRPNDINVIGD